MKVIKRNGEIEDVQFDKIKERLSKLKLDFYPNLQIDLDIVSKQVIANMGELIKTSDLDHLASEQAAFLVTQHPDYGLFAGMIEISNLHKETPTTFYESLKILQQTEGLVNPDFMNFVTHNHEAIEAMIDYSRDYGFDYFAYRTLEKSYLLKSNQKIIERPQHMFMRVAVNMWYKENNLSRVQEMYHHLSTKQYTHATPTLFNSGTKNSQLASCFLLPVNDSLIDIYAALTSCAQISKSAGGIGISIHKIRAKYSKILGTNGISNGLVPMLKVFNETARYVDQGGGKRKGSIAVYLETWHADIFDFLDLKLNHGKEELRARDLFYALWISDLFMKRVEADGLWTLFDPNTAKGLESVYGEEFNQLYEKYEKQGLGKTLEARKVWEKIIDTQIQTGGPYLLYKDAANFKSNQKNLGVIQSSNLCAEIIEYTSKDEFAVCNLASICLNQFAPMGKLGENLEVKSYDFQALYEITRVVTRNLNRVIDMTTYPVEQTKVSNLKHRPIGIGVQGLADAYLKMRFPFTSIQAKDLNKKIFETIYFAALTESLALAKEQGSYSSFQGSPLSQGIFQYELWGLKDEDLSGMWDFGSLRTEIQQYGIRNSLLVALMPTASTAQIMGNNECFEPIVSNIIARRVLSGDFLLINKYMHHDLLELGMWNEEVRQSIIRNGGSVQHLDIPQELKELYKTVWEFSQREIIDQAADRGVFVCQSQSMNLFLTEPTYKKVSAMHLYAWKKGLKTGQYYLRQKPKAAVQFTV